MSTTEADAHLDASRATWLTRNRHTWTLDLRILTDAAIALARPPDAAHRVEISDDELRCVRGPR